MIWILLGWAVLLTPAGTLLLFGGLLQVYLRRKLLDRLVRIFEEKPLFVIPRGEPAGGAEPVIFPSRGGVELAGIYLRAHGPRRGVILFAPEFGSDRWACRPYCEGLRRSGYDVCCFEPRNQGVSGREAGYEPTQWATDRDLSDILAALAYLRGRPDRDPNGVGLFGISKGGTAAILAAAESPDVRCVVTDGAFGTYSVVVPYMRKWVAIYDTHHLSHGLFPAWYYGLVARAGMARVERERGVRFCWAERAVRRVRVPLLMIHGAADSYIKTEMARTLFDAARGPKDFWLVPEARHNQALRIAGLTYHEKVRRFFDRHLAGLQPETAFAAETANLPQPFGTTYAAE